MTNYYTNFPKFYYEDRKRFKVISIYYIEKLNTLFVTTHSDVCQIFHKWKEENINVVIIKIYEQDLSFRYENPIICNERIYDYSTIYYSLKTSLIYKSCYMDNNVYTMFYYIDIRIRINSAKFYIIDGDYLICFLDRDIEKNNIVEKPSQYLNEIYVYLIKYTDEEKFNYKLLNHKKISGERYLKIEENYDKKIYYLYSYSAKNILIYDYNKNILDFISNYQFIRRYNEFLYNTGSLPYFESIITIKNSIYRISDNQNNFTIYKFPENFDGWIDKLNHMFDIKIKEKVFLLMCVYNKIFIDINLYLYLNFIKFYIDNILLEK